MDAVQEARRVGPAAGRVRRDRGAAGQCRCEAARPDREARAARRGNPFCSRRTDCARPARSFQRRQSATARQARAAARDAGRGAACGRVDRRDQVRWLSPDDADRERQGQARHARRSRLDEEARIAGHGDRVARHRLGLARRRDRRHERCRRAEFQRPSERDRLVEQRRNRLLRVRPAVLRRPRSAQAPLAVASRCAAQDH